MIRQIRRTASAAGGLIAALQFSASAAALPTYKGPAISNPFGSVRVTIRVSGTHVVGLSATGPRHAAYSRRLSTRALPILRREALRAQSPRINGVSGATYTSNGFERSLCKALVKARLISACSAPETPLPEQWAHPHPPVRLEGIVQSVDAKAYTLKVQVTSGPQSGGQVTIGVTRRTNINGASSLSRISPNDHVVVFVEESSHSFLALNIDDLTVLQPPEPLIGPAPEPEPGPTPIPNG